MIVINYNTDLDFFLKKYDGDDFEIISAEQHLNQDETHAECLMQLKTDLNEIITIKMPINWLRKDSFVEKSNLKHFLICSKNKLIFFETDSQKDAYDEYRHWINKEMDNIMEFARKRIKIDIKKKEIEMDFK